MIRDAMIYALCVACLMCAAIGLACILGCITTETTMPDGTVIHELRPVPIDDITGYVDLAERSLADLEVALQRAQAIRADLERMETQTDEPNRLEQIRATLAQVNAFIEQVIAAREAARTQLNAQPED